MTHTLIQGGHIVTQNKKRDCFVGDILIRDQRIEKISKNISAPSDALIVKAENQFVIPGLIQTHTHLCQALFRGLADDLSLLDWLKKRIWPLEAAHDAASISASARLGLLEMQSLGTTTILDMGTVQHTDSLFAAAEESGMRYWGGKCLMDLKKFSGPLYEEFNISMNETRGLIKRWHKKNSLLEYAVCPRFAISCSEEMLLACGALQKEFGILIHTHASENKEEVALIKKRTGKRNIDYFAKLGLLNKNTVIAHGIHMSDGELNKMIKAKASITHCPSSNLKLASGLADIEKYLKRKLKVGIGSDGAPCNNTMDAFYEIRLAALLQKPNHGPKALPAERAFDLATVGGAKVLNRESDLGSLEEGKLADIVTVSREHPSVGTVENPYSALVYSCSGRDVVNVMINGKFVIKNHSHTKWQRDQILGDAKLQLQKLQKRSALA